MDKLDKCFFCGSSVPDFQVSPLSQERVQDQYLKFCNYKCGICGDITLKDWTREFGELEVGSLFSNNDKMIIRIVLRNEHERRKGSPPTRALSMKELSDIVKQYRELDALEKMDKALEIIDKTSKRIGERITINWDTDFSYYHCSESSELRTILEYLRQENLTESPDASPRVNLRITPRGYERLRELKKSSRASRQCFVAMWFTSEMSNVYEKAIKPAIQYVEEAQSEPRFTALKIDQKEHTNDINDEIISEIRRSRFMVCDLTGYRGGVYWESGFAYGLGLEVIYTCKEDWIRPKTETEGEKVKVTQEGIHFDLEHRNRIEWKDGPEGLEEFKNSLAKRIRAVIV